MNENISPFVENYSKYYPPRITDTWPPLIYEEKKKIKYPGSHLPPLLSDYIPPTLYDKPESNSHAPNGRGSDFKEPHIVYPTNSGESFTQYENAWNMNDSTVVSHREITLGSRLQSKPVIPHSKRFYQQLVTTPQTDETQVYRKPMAEPDSPINPIEYTTININPKSPGINIVIKDKPHDVSLQNSGINNSIPSPSSSETLDEDFEYYSWYDDDESYITQPDDQSLQDNNQPLSVPGVGSKKGPAPNALTPSLVPDINYKPVSEENQYLSLSEDNTQYSKDYSEPGIYSTGKE